MCVIPDWLAAKLKQFDKHECARLCGNQSASSGDKTSEQTRLTVIIFMHALCVKGV